MMNVHLGGKKKDTWTSLVVQWLRIHLPMKGTQVQSLVQEDTTCYRELSRCTTSTEPVLHTTLLTTTRKKPMQCNEDPAQPEIYK